MPDLLQSFWPGNGLHQEQIDFLHYSPGFNLVNCIQLIAPPFRTSSARRALLILFARCDVHCITLWRVIQGESGPIADGKKQLFSAFCRSLATKMWSVVQ
jgi:hypothetical protein